MTAYLCDANIWIAATITGHVHHAPARAWLTSTDAGDQLYFCRATQQAYLRLSTTAAIFARFGALPVTNHEAWSLYDALLQDDRVSFRPEPSGLETAWRRLADRATASPKLWMDAYLAAFAIADGCTLVTTDVAFRQFRGLDLTVVGGQAREKTGARGHSA